MNNEEYERLFKQLRRLAMISIGFCVLCTNLRDLEKDPNKPVSRVVAFTSVGYIGFQLADAFTRIKNPRSMVLDFISIFFGFATIAIALVANIFFIFFN